MKIYRLTWVHTGDTTPHHNYSIARSLNKAITLLETRYGQEIDVTDAEFVDETLGDILFECPDNNI